MSNQCRANNYRNILGVTLHFYMYLELIKLALEKVFETETEKTNLAIPLRLILLLSLNVF